METRPKKFFYGWWVVLTAAIGLLLGYAPIFVFSFGVFVKSLVKEFHSNRTQISLAFTLANVMFSVSSPLAGRLVDRFGVRRVMLPGTLIFGFLLISFKFISTSLWQLYVIFLALGLIGGTAQVPYIKVVSNWFDRRRGLALGLTMAGVATGAIVMPPIAQRLISVLGWRSAYATLSVLGLVVAIPMVALFLKDSPKEKGLLPDGGVDFLAQSEERPEKQGLTWSAARSSSTFWLMVCGFSLVGASVHACVIHLVPHAYRSRRQCRKRSAGQFSVRCSSIAGKSGLRVRTGSRLRALCCDILFQRRRLRPFLALGRSGRSRSICRGVSGGPGPGR